MPIIERTRRRLRIGVGRARLRGDCEGQGDGDVVVQVALGWRGRSYAYLCRGKPQLGDIVEITTPYSGLTRAPIVGFGRQGYEGPLKRARLVR